jgi:hypothetical protein
MVSRNAGSIRPARILVTFTTYNGAIFCVKKWSTELRWDGRAVAMQNVLQETKIPAVPC